MLSLTLRGVWTMRKSEIDWYFRGVRAIMPDAYSEWQGFLPPEERDNMIKAYHDRLMNPDPAVHQPAADAFMRYALCAGALAMPDETAQKMEPQKVLSGMRIAMHFMHNHYPTEAVWQGIEKIKHIPTTIVQGRYDALTPAVTAFELSRRLQDCSLEIVVAGHSAVDPAIMRGLVAATNRIRDKGSPVLRKAA